MNTCSSCKLWRPVAQPLDPWPDWREPQGTCAGVGLVWEGDKCAHHRRDKVKPRKPIPCLDRFIGWLGALLYPTED